MSKVLFAHSYFYKRDAKQWRFKQPYPPLGTLQAIGVARRAGFDVRLFDACLKDHPEEIIPVLEQEKPDYFIIYDDGFNYLTKMCLTVMREAAFAMAAQAKQKGCTVISSSSDSTDHSDQYFAHGVDYIIRGEGEETLVELLHSLDQKSDVSLLPGIAFRQGGETIVTPSRPLMRDLDSLPLPAWDLADIGAYRQIWMKYHGYFSLNLATTRGCPFKCNWCAKPIYGNRYHSRSPEQVVREIEFVINTYHPDHFWMCDDIFGLKPGWVKRFSEIVQEKQLSFVYKIQSRADLLLEENAIQSLAASGCKTVWIGAESGSQKVLDAMDKGITVQQIRTAIGLLHKNGIKAGFFLQFGYPGETKADIDATLHLVLNTMPDEIGISVSYPLPGTKFYENVKSQLQEKQNWTDSDDLALLYKNTYPPSFYKILHRYVHNRYRIQRGIELVKSAMKRPTRPKLANLKTLASMVYHTPFTFLRAYQLKKFTTENAL
jgi:radical SAM superfamily enzyme YgiQ (UPF0313 family)